MRFALALSLLLLPSLAYAQFGDIGLEPFTLTVSPQYPRPGVPITITPESTALDLTGSTMTVTVDGKNIHSGDAEAVTIPMGGPGQTIKVRVSLVAQGKTFSKILSFNPGDVSLVEEPVSSAHALYQGRPLTPQGGMVRLAAVADFRTTPSKRLDPDALSYEWRVDNTILHGSSGIGKNILTLPSPLQYRKSEVVVIVKNSSGMVVGADSLKLSPGDPVVRIYEDNPLMGILFDHALSGTHAITGTEMSLLAMPYSFSMTEKKPEFNWSLNGAFTQNERGITLRPQGSGEGRANLSFTANNAATFENASAAVSITFGSSNSGFFGL